MAADPPDVFSGTFKLYLDHDAGIGVEPEAKAAVEDEKVSAMHDKLFTKQFRHAANRSAVHGHDIMLQRGKAAIPCLTN